MARRDKGSLSNSDAAALGYKIKWVRESLGLSQSKFAASLGLSTSGISSAECGRSPLSDERLKSICAKYDVNYEWLMRGEGQPFGRLAQDALDISESEQCATVGGRIKWVRSHFRLPCTAFAAAIGVSDPTLSAYEGGRVAPSHSALERICDNYGISYSWLHSGVGNIYCSSDDPGPLTTAGSRLKYLRISTGLIQADMAALLGISIKRLSDLERDRDDLSNRLAVTICKRFGINLEWLVDGSGPKYYSLTPIRDIKLASPIPDTTARLLAQLDPEHFELINSVAQYLIDHKYKEAN